MRLGHVCVLWLLTALPAMAQVERVGDATARFNGKGPGGFKLEGTTHELSIKDDGQTVTYVVPLATLKTGIDLRDRHMREKYLQTDKYPDAVLVVPWSAIRLPESGQAVTQTVTGQLSLHGKTKDVPVTYTVRRNGEVYETTGSVPLNIKDFGIDIPSYLGVTVKPDIETSVAFSFKRK
ncbi:YceI family protein [Archangium lansingense]|uniref:YceI family protein n=1 Tax=Archangium lansingense TaxID=2995310 RepID=UPI003B78F490